MRKLACIVFALFVALGASANATGDETTGAKQLAAIVSRALALAPTNFQGAYGKLTNSSSEERDYLATGPLAKDCAKCTVQDEFATGDTDERWVYEFDFGTSAAWKKSRIIEFAEASIGPLVREYDLKTGTTDDGETYLDWKSKNTFVYVETYSGKTPGVDVRVGHYLHKNVHVVPYSGTLTDAEKTRLANDVKNMLSLALAHASENFATLRGKSTGKLDYDANVSFDDMIGSCDIEYSPATSGGNDATWRFGCDTAPLGGSSKDLEEFLRQTIWYALPSSYKVSADADKGTNDYRWEDGNAQVVVTLNADPYLDSRYTYAIRIYQFPH